MTVAKIIQGANVRILGRSTVGEGTVLDDFVVIGHPGKDEKDVLLSQDFARLEGARIGKSCVIRTHTTVYNKAALADKVNTGHFVLIRERTTVGEGTLVGTGTIVDDHVRIGKGVSIQSGVYIPTNSVIGDRVFLGPRVCLTNDKYMGRGKVVLEGVVIEEGARLGANCTVLPGVTVGRDAVVGSGAVVTKDVPPGKVVAGVPARVTGDVPKEHRLP